MENMAYTYKLKRACLHCQKPIGDQQHAAIKFCHRVVLPDGSIQSCKDDFHALKSKDRNLPYKRIADYHKDAHEKIGNLLRTKGEDVTTEQINQYGIILKKPVEFMVDINQKTTYYFIEFAFKQITSNQFKIFKHGRIL